MTRRLLHIALIIVLAGIFYAPSLRNDFIWDDDDYIQNNAAVQSPEGLRDIWFSYEMPQYYPVVFSTFWVEHKLWGLDPYGYHVVNLALHIGNALLLYLILLHLYPPLALAASLLFALHPVQVETVAWVTERKNLLGGLFYLLAILFYVRFLDTDKRRNYVSAFVAFVLALLSKSITVSFVVAPLFIKWWRGQKIIRTDFLKLLPFAVIGLVCGINTIYLEMHRVGAKGEQWALSLAEHLILPGQIILFYIYKILLPSELIFFYPRWQLDPGQFRQWLPLAAVIALGVTLYRCRDRIGRGAFANYLYFICAIFPALGFFNVYPMIYSWVADHFQYLASINLIVLLAGAGALLIARIQAVGNRQLGALAKTAMPCVVLAVVSGLYGYKIVEHSRHFASLETLWRDVIEKNDGSWAAHNNLGLLYQGQGKTAESVAEFQKAATLNPGHSMVRSNLGLAYYVLGRVNDARHEFETALQLDQQNSKAYNNLGRLYLDAHDDDAAYAYLRKAAELNPDMISAHGNLYEYYLSRQLYDQAVAELLRVIELSPGDCGAMQKLGELFERLGRSDDAGHWYRRALSVDPRFPPAHNRLGNLLARRGDLREALAEYQLALQGNPDFIDSLFNAGQAHLLLGERERAVFYFRRVLELGVDLPPDIAALVVGQSEAVK